MTVLKTKKERESFMSKKMSRRSFLKMTAAGAVGAAGMGVFAPLSAIAEEKQTAANESPRRFGADGNQYKMKRSRGSAQRRCPRLLF